MGTEGSTVVDARHRLVHLGALFVLGFKFGLLEVRSLLLWIGIRAFLASGSEASWGQDRLFQDLMMAAYRGQLCDHRSRRHRVNGEGALCDFPHSSAVWSSRSFSLASLATFHVLSHSIRKSEIKKGKADSPVPKTRQGKAASAKREREGREREERGGEKARTDSANRQGGGHSGRLFVNEDSTFPGTLVS